MKRVLMMTMLMPLLGAAAPMMMLSTGQKADTAGIRGTAADALEAAVKGAGLTPDPFMSGLIGKLREGIPVSRGVGGLERPNDPVAEYQRAVGMREALEVELERLETTGETHAVHGREPARVKQGKTRAEGGGMGHAASPRQSRGSSVANMVDRPDGPEVVWSKNQQPARADGPRMRGLREMPDDSDPEPAGDVASIRAVLRDAALADPGH